MRLHIKRHIPAMLIDNPRILLSHLRNSDYAHAGEQEAIDIVLQGISRFIHHDAKHKLKMLDVGCGLGGTAAYIKNKTHADLYGIDIDNHAIQYANKYQNIHFFNCNVENTENIFPHNEFDVIYSFNSFYAFANQEQALKSLATITKRDGLLVIFDYMQTSKDANLSLTDLAGKKMHFIIADEFNQLLNKTGWKLIQTHTLNHEYKKWYVNAISQLHSNKNLLLQKFTEHAYNQVNETFLNLITHIQSKKLGGSIFYGKLK